MRSALLASLLANLLAGCAGTIGDAEEVEVVTTSTRLVVAEVPWNPRAVELGQIDAVADSPDAVALFGDKGATSLAGDGTVVGSDPAVRTWTSAATIPGPLGGNWQVGVDGDGKLHRLTGKGGLEAISDRFGLAFDKVTKVVAAGRGAAAVAFEGGLLVAAGYSVVRQPGVEGCAVLAGGYDRIACGNIDTVDVFRVGKREQRTYRVSGVRYAAFDASGRLVVATTDTLYLEDLTRRELSVIFRSDVPIRALIGAGSRVWLTLGNELAVVDGRDVAITEGQSIADDARLLPSSTGDVWVISKSKVQRMSAAVSAARNQFEKEVRPVVERLCAGCHGALDPTSKIDLSTYDRWAERRDAIKRRVLDVGDMPPGTLTLTADERAAVRRFVD